MTRPVFTLILTIFFSGTLQAQPGNRQFRGKILDSLNVAKPVKTVKQPAGASSRQKSMKPVNNRVNNTKLDDLKNPFDTSKVIQTRDQNFSWGATNGANTQNQRTQQPNRNRIDSLRVGRKPVKQTVSSPGNTGVSPHTNKRNGLTTDSLRTPQKTPPAAIRRTGVNN